MSLDNSIRAIAYSEASTLGAAIALIAKRRNELDAAMRAAEIEAKPVVSEGAAEQRALLAMSETASAHLLDKVA